MVSDLVKNEYSNMRSRMKKTYKKRASQNQAFNHQLMEIDRFENKSKNKSKWKVGLTN